MTPTLKTGRVISPGRPEKKDIFKEMLAGVTDLRREGRRARCKVHLDVPPPAPGVCGAAAASATA